MQFECPVAIEKEKSIADAVLERLEVIDPACILAGGAPRDWWLGKSANDLDFYLHTPQNNTQLEKNLAMLGLPVTPLRQQAFNVKANKLDDLYNTMPNLRTVYETIYRGKAIQIMVMSKPTFTSVVDEFAVDISKVWYKNGAVHPYPEAKRARNTKTIRVAKGYSRNTRYVKKMGERFPEYFFQFELSKKKQPPMYGNFDRFCHCECNCICF